LIDYFFKSFNPKKFNLTMTILVKNEEDIIEANIKAHSKLGVDSFIVMDNNSTDGTREILEELKKEYEIIIIDEKGYYQQKKWMTKLAFLAKKKYKSNWVINNDADEFWIPQNNLNLKENLSFKGGVLQVSRSNMVIYNDIDNWYDSEYKVINQVNYKVGKPNIILGKIGRKTIVNPYGLIQINSGNHSAEHIAFHKKQEFSNIHIYHYPIRSFEQFKNNIENRKWLLENIKNVKMGNHYRRWVKIYNDGNLEKEYENLLLLPEDINTLIKMNILKKTMKPKNLLKGII
jgi:rRNA processing protein Gar1